MHEGDLGHGVSFGRARWQFCKVEVRRGLLACRAHETEWKYGLRRSRASNVIFDMKQVNVLTSTWGQGLPTRHETRFVFGRMARAWPTRSAPAWWNARKIRPLWCARGPHCLTNSDTGQTQDGRCRSAMVSCIRLTDMTCSGLRLRQSCWITVYHTPYPIALIWAPPERLTKRDRGRNGLCSKRDSHDYECCYADTKHSWAID